MRRLLLALLIALPCAAADDVDLPQRWQFNGGADVSPLLAKGNVPPSWNGSGWFRAKFDIREDDIYLLKIRQAGTSEVWIDGRKIATFNTATGRSVVEIAGGAHEIAIHYVNPSVASYHSVGDPGGFTVSLARGTKAVEADIALARANAGYLWFFTGIFLAFATLHLLMFAFTPEIPENLYFSLLCITVAVLAFFLFYREQMVDPRVLLFAERAMNVAGVSMGFCLLRYVYGTFLDEIPRQLWLYGALALSVALWSMPNAATAMFFVFILMLVSLIEATRVVIVALIRRKSGARIIGGGILAVAIGFGIGLLANLGFLPHTPITSRLLPMISIVILLGLMSFYISRQFAITNQQLREKLVENEMLSAQQLESERRHQQEQAERRLLEAEYQRKAQELEEARALQLSMLPSRVPELPNIAIAARMDTATEVGGDYYDFEIGEDGTLTIAIGDATGHGMRAGTMVTAAKTLFGVFSQNPDLRETLSRSTLALKRMNLRKLSMALTLAQVRDGTLRISAAGMPPVCVWHATTGDLEQVQLRGMPLGAVARFPYEHHVVQLQPGDAVLFMTDGFPERLSVSDEMFGYERALDAFCDAARGTPAEIIESLCRAAERWADGRAADDDVTFVVLKVRAA